MIECLRGTAAVIERPVIQSVRSPSCTYHRFLDCGQKLAGKHILGHTYWQDTFGHDAQTESAVPEDQVDLCHLLVDVQLDCCLAPW